MSGAGLGLSLDTKEAGRLHGSQGGKMLKEE